ncbi:MAG: hypothetical protein QM628_10780 [Propionicimonas sp.]
MAVPGWTGYWAQAREADGTQVGEQFTWSVWIRVPDRISDTLGALLSTFDLRTRHGAELGLVYGASTSSQHNLATVEFGADWGSDPRWQSLGRPGLSAGVLALAVHDGDLYAGSVGGDGRGSVHRYRGGEWVALPGAGDTNCVNALASFDGHLYAGVSRYRTGGSAMSIPENPEPGGEIFRLTSADTWESTGRLQGADAVTSLVVHDGRLYAAAMYQEGVFVLDETGWRPVGSPGRRVLTLGSAAGRLVAGGNDHADPDSAISQTRAGIVVPQRDAAGGGGVFALEAPYDWRCYGMQPDTTQVYSLTTWQGRILASTWPNGYVFARGDDDWESIGRLGAETEVMGLAVYNGALYGGTLPHAQVHQYRGGQSWVEVGELDTTPEALYRRAAGLAIHDGALVWGCLPSGTVHAMRTGDVVTGDRTLSPGWHHLVASRGLGVHRLHLDGAIVAEVRSAETGPIAAGPLRVGAGARTDFAGELRQLRIYDRVLDADEVAQLFACDDPQRAGTTFSPHHPTDLEGRS